MYMWCPKRPSNRRKDNYLLSPYNGKNSLQLQDTKSPEDPPHRPSSYIKKVSLHHVNPLFLCDSPKYKWWARLHEEIKENQVFMEKN